jgi:predicted permease
VKFLSWRRRRQEQLEEELQSHLEMAARDRIDRGESRGQAVSAACREFGNVALVQHVTRDQWGWTWLEDFVQDVRYAARTLRKNPSFTAIALLTLALGIGANTAIFSVVNTVLLRPLPYPDADRLVAVWEKVRLPTYQNDQNSPAPGNFADWRRQNTVFREMAAVRYRSFNLTGDGEPVRVEGEAVSASLFPLLQVNAKLGRVFTPEEDVAGGPRVVLISEGLWISRFGGNLGIVGKSILLDGESYSVIGLMPRWFHFPDPDDQLWIPIGLRAAELANHDSHYLRVFAALKPGVSVAQAQAELKGIAARLSAQYPNSNTGVSANVISLHDQVVGNVRPALLILLGAVGLILLMGCANVANLLLARASVRYREIAIRSAFGASRTRILRQLLTESVLLALFGGVLGLLLSYWGVRWLKWIGPQDLPRLGEIRLDSAVLLFTLGLSMLCGVLFGVAPSIQASRSGATHSLKEGAGGGIVRSRIEIRKLLIVGEIAIGLVVLVGAGLLFRSFLHLVHTPLGFQPDNVLTFRVIPRGERYAQPAQRTAFYQQAIERIGSLPGVRSASAVTFLPLTLARAAKGFSIEGSGAVRPGELPMADYDVVAPEYFATMRIPLLEGRDVGWNDTPQTEPVIVVNRSFARKCWPNESALGKRIKPGRPDEQIPWLTVVGVVADFRRTDVGSQPRPAMYFPVSQFEDAAAQSSRTASSASGVLRDWVVRSSSDPGHLAAAVRSAVWSIDKDLPISRVRTLEQVRSASVAPQAFDLLLLGLFAWLGLTLAAIGLYGVISYSVTQRNHEIGVRMALGAASRDVLRQVLMEGARLAMIGLAIGVAAGVAVTRLMSSLLYEITATDPLTFLGVAVLLTLVALVACYIPARRATRVDPIVALRYE